MDEPSKKDGFVELLGGGGGNTPKEFDVFCAFISRVPAASFDSGSLNEDGSWRAQIRIDIDHMLAWQVVQEFGFVLNWVSVTEPLPTRFFPRSSPPYLNGAPVNIFTGLLKVFLLISTPIWRQNGWRADYLGRSTTSPNGHWKMSNHSHRIGENCIKAIQ